MDWKEPCALPEDDPLYQALKGRKARQAWRLLRRREKLSWTEAADYAPLTLGWAPRLLERILELGPREELYCRHLFPSPSGNWEILLTASLLTAAAAADDLAAVELLLARGYWTGQGGDRAARIRQRRNHLTAWYRLVSAGRGHPYIYDMCHFYAIPNPFPDDCSCGQIECDALSIAIELGAVRCALRLLPQRAEELSWASCCALRRTRYAGLDEMSSAKAEELEESGAEEERRRRAAVEAVLAVYGEDRLDLEVCRDEEELQRLYSGDPLFWRTLKQHPEWLTPKWVGELVDEAENGSWALDLLKQAPPEAVSGWMAQELLQDQKDWKKAAEYPGFPLVIHRQAIPVDLKCPLVEVLDGAEVVGEPPEVGLSGLAACLLNQILLSGLKGPGPQAWSQCQLLRHPKTLPILQKEDPAMVWAYLKWKAKQEAISEEVPYMLRVLLNLDREDRIYEL